MAQGECYEVSPRRFVELFYELLDGLRLLTPLLGILGHRLPRPQFIAWGYEPLMRLPRVRNRGCILYMRYSTRFTSLADGDSFSDRRCAVGTGKGNPPPPPPPPPPSRADAGIAIKEAGKGGNK